MNACLLVGSIPSAIEEVVNSIPPRVRLVHEAENEEREKEREKK